MKNNEYAGFWIRALANFIDGLVLVIPAMVINSMVYQAVLGMSRREHQQAMTEIYGALGEFYFYEVPLEVNVWVYPISLVVGLLYSAVLTASSWQGTVGKKMLGLQVVDLDGNRLTAGRAIGRYFAYFASSVTLYIGYIMVGLTDNKQGLHDKIAKTYVVKQK